MVTTIDGRVEKAMYCSDWVGHVWIKSKSSYVGRPSLYSGGYVGNGTSWSDMVLFEPWKLHEQPRSKNIRVINVVQAARRRILG